MDKHFVELQGIDSNHKLLKVVFSHMLVTDILDFERCNPVNHLAISHMPVDHNLVAEDRQVAIHILVKLHNLGFITIPYVTNSTKLGHEPLMKLIFSRVVDCCL